MLRATLDTVSAGEVLWLVGRSRVTGTLRVRGDASGTVWCRDGFVTWASIDDGADLVDVLAQAGLVPAGLDRTAAADQLDAELRTGPGASRIHELVRTATEDAVFEMAAWGAGEVAFDEQAPHRFASDFCFPVAAVLDAVRRRRPAWTGLMARLGSAGCVVAQAPAGPGEGDLTISRAQWRLLAAIDGRRDLVELARLTGGGLFGTAEMVAGLLDAGMVEVVAGSRPAPPAAAPSHPSHPAATAARPAAGRHLSVVPGGAVATLARELSLPAAEFVDAGDNPSRDLILRLLSAVKEL